MGMYLTNSAMTSGRSSFHLPVGIGHETNQDRSHSAALPVSSSRPPMLRLTMERADRGNVMIRPPVARLRFAPLWRILA
jgi:hypothetical protein